MSEEETNYFQESYYSGYEEPATEEQSAAEPTTEQVDPKVAELETKYQTLLQQQQQQLQQQEAQKQAIAQAYGFNSQPQLDPNVKAAHDLIDGRVKEQFGQDYERRLAAQVMQGVEGNRHATEMGFHGYQDASGNYVTAWDSAKMVYHGLLSQVYATADPQLKAQIENIYNMANVPGREAEVLKQAAEITGYTRSGSNNQQLAGTQTLGHPPGTAQTAKAPGVAYSSQEEWLKDFYDGDSAARERAQQALRKGQV